MRAFLTTAIVFACTADVGTADDWPTHRYNNQRTGRSSEELSLPLAKLWSRALARPSPAWPPPAKQDFWNRKHNLRSRITHDRAHGIVVADDRLLVSSAVDDSVQAFDALTGRRLWNAHAEAPIRLAPTVWKTNVVFGSDDGYVYAVDLGTGERLWRTRPDLIGTRRIPGNGRIISERPIRSGVLIRSDGTGYFAAGIFPKYDAYFFSINVTNGKLLDNAPIDKSIQGYLEYRNGRVFGPTGRDPKGAFLTSPEDSNDAPQGSSIETQAYSEAADATHRFLGLDGRVVAVAPTDSEFTPVWSADVEGIVYDLAISNGRLFCSTDQGGLYVFGSAAADTNGQLPSTDQPRSRVRYRDFALLIEPTPQVAREFALQHKTTRVVVAVDQEKQASLIRDEVTPFENVAVHTIRGTTQLPYAHRIFSTIQGGLRADVEPFLRPYGGRAVCRDGEIVVHAPSNVGSWTHTYGTPGNLASSTTQLSTALRLQWFGGPGPRKMVDRHLRTMPSLVEAGRLFIPAQDRVLVVDAYTGNVTDELETPGSTRIGILKDCGWMVAKDRRLYIASKYECKIYDVTESGQLQGLRSVAVPLPERHWGYLAVDGSRIIGSTALPTGSRRRIARDAILEGAYSDSRPLVASDSLFSVRTQDLSDKWQYRSDGMILNPTISSNGTSVFFLENSKKLIDQELGRISLDQFLEDEPRIVALDLASGKFKWSKPIARRTNAQSTYLLAGNEQLIHVTSRNAETVHYDTEAFDTTTGDRIWQVTQDNQHKTGGTHGEQDKHPALTGSRLVVEPYVYDVATGKRLEQYDLKPRGYGCGTISASANALFFRSGNPAYYSFDSNSINTVTATTRPGCWINMLPAEGMLLIPEASSGCTCNYAVQTSMALVPE